MFNAAQPISHAYIGLGSNVGDREAHLRAAIAALGQLGEVCSVSSFYETEPVGTIQQPDFLNAVVELRTALSPQRLMMALLSIEQEQGRDRGAGPPKGPRTLDLDMLAFGQLILDTPSLTLPHPSLAERAFVLVPLQEIAPEWRHPVSDKTASELLDDLARVEPGARRTVRKISAPPHSS